MHIIKISIATLSAGILLSACSAQQSSVPAVDSSPAPVEEAQELTETTVKTGRIEQIGENFYLTQASGEKIVLDSYNINLRDYLDQSHTVTGQYSGDTLFVGSIE